MMPTDATPSAAISPGPEHTRIIEKINPATGVLTCQYSMTTEPEIIQMVEKARRAQTAWAQTALNVRARLLHAVADRLYEAADSLAAIISEETGKPLSDAIESDIAGALGLLRYNANVGPRCLKSRRLAPDAMSRLIFRFHWETWHPRGVIAIISPWNYPVAIPTGSIATALMAGNAVVFKPSELAPACGLRLAALFQEVLAQTGFSPDLVQVLCGDGETGQILLQQDIQGIIFTGSSRVGRSIRMLAAERGLWSSLELGGSDAMLVLEGMNPELATSFAVWGRFSNAGQACASVKRLFVPVSIAETIITHLQEKIALLRVASPIDETAHLGPLISKIQRDILDAQVQDALHRGATLLAGGGPKTGPGWFYEPTLLRDVPPDADLMQKEAFGPVLPVIVYDDIDEAIAQINASFYGLTTSILGNPRQAQAVASRFECGSVIINDAGATNFIAACAPWGGWKESGHGVSHGEHALKELCRLQIVSENGMMQIPGFQRPPWHFSRLRRSVGKRSQVLLALANGFFRQWRFSTLVALIESLRMQRSKDKL